MQNHKYFSWRFVYNVSVQFYHKSVNWSVNQDHIFTFLGHFLSPSLTRFWAFLGADSVRTIVLVRTDEQSAL